MEDPDDSFLDPRIYKELDKLNKASEDINSLEVDLDNSRAMFRYIMNDSILQLEAMAKRLGSCVEKARPYYDARKRALEAQICTQNAAMKFEKACSQLTAAKEMVNLAEQGYFKMGQKFDPAWQEMLNHSTIKVNDAEKERLECEVSHRMTMFVFNEAEQNVRRLQKEYKRSISKSKPYFELKARFNQMMEDQKKKIERLEGLVVEAKAFYSDTLRTLESISDEIHKSRERQAGGRTQKRRSRHRRVVVRPKRPDQIYHPLMDSSEVILEEVSSPEDEDRVVSNLDAIHNAQKMKRTGIVFPTGGIGSGSGSSHVPESPRGDRRLYRSLTGNSINCEGLDLSSKWISRVQKDGEDALLEGEISNSTAKSVESTTSCSTVLGPDVVTVESSMSEIDGLSNLSAASPKNSRTVKSNDVRQPSPPEEMHTHRHAVHSKVPKVGKMPLDPFESESLSIDRVVMQQKFPVASGTKTFSRVDLSEPKEARRGKNDNHIERAEDWRKPLPSHDAKKRKISPRVSNPRMLREWPSRTPPHSESSPEPEKESDHFRRTSYSFLEESRQEDESEESFFSLFSESRRDPSHRRSPTSVSCHEAMPRSLRGLRTSPSRPEPREGDVGSETESLASSLNSATLLDDEQIESLMVETGQYHRFLSQMDAQESENYRRLTLPNKLRYLKDLVSFDPLWQDNGSEEEEGDVEEVESDCSEKNEEYSLSHSEGGDSRAKGAKDLSSLIDCPLSEDSLVVRMDRLLCSRETKCQPPSSTPKVVQSAIANTQRNTRKNKN